MRGLAGSMVLQLRADGARAIIPQQDGRGGSGVPTLEFKGKQHIYAHHLTVPYRPLIPDPDRSVNAEGDADLKNPDFETASPSDDGNLIIHGDNLHALKALLPRYAGRVKCIYIDPPYNTGNEGWAYNDARHAQGVA